MERKQLSLYFDVDNTEDLAHLFILNLEFNSESENSVLLLLDDNVANNNNMLTLDFKQGYSTNCILVVIHA